MTPHWCDEVRRRVAARPGLTFTAIARAAGITSASLSQILTGDVVSSRAIPAVNRAVGLPPPVIETGGSGGVRDELRTVAAGLDESDAWHVLRFARYLASESAARPTRARRKLPT